MNCTFKKKFFPAFLTVIVLFLVLSSSYYVLFCFEFNEGEEYVARKISDRTVNANGDISNFEYSSNEYARLTDEYYYKFDDEGADLLFLGYMSHKGLLRMNIEHKLYSFESDEEKEFLFYDDKDRYSNLNVYYRDDLILPDIIPENVKEIELYLTNRSLFDDGRMSNEEPDLISNDSELIELLISGFKNDGNQTIDYLQMRKQIFSYTGVELSDRSYYVCLTFNGYNENFCYLLGELKGSISGQLAVFDSR